MKLTVDFQVELDNPEDKKLLATVKHLKKHHKFVPTLRDALRLILDLRSGSTSVLFELFPWLIGQGISPNSPTPPDVDYDKLTTEIAEKVVLMGGANRLEMSASQNVEPPRKQLGQGIQQQLSAPIFEDDDIVIETKKDTKNTAANNFLAGLAGLYQ